VHYIGKDCFYYAFLRPAASSMIPKLSVKALDFWNELEWDSNLHWVEQWSKSIRLHSILRHLRWPLLSLVGFRKGFSGG
jgi:hypothetical protein